MKILLLLSESWNDKTAPNNNLTNWFLNFPNVEIWTISGNGQLPENRCCKDYFQVSENGMLKSIFTGNKVGKTYHFADYPQDETKGKMLQKKKVKSIFSNEAARLCRDFVWRYGRYDVEALKKFISDCQPDIILTQRRGSVKMCRLEQLVMSFTDAPMVAYTGDDEYSLQQFSFSPIFWIRRFWVRKWLKKMIPQYRLFYCQSERQMKEFAKEFGVEMKFLVKCGDFEKEKIHQQVGQPIQLVYAGKLYCNRWKTLAILVEEIEKVNAKYDKEKVKLNIYTTDRITKKQNQMLNNGTSSIIHGAVPGSELPKIYNNSDVVLHIESFDLKNRLLTQDSFSTKVMDCLASGCAVMAICWKGHAAYQYLEKKDAALVADSREKIRLLLERMVSNVNVILEYSQKAYLCGQENHQREQIQDMLKRDFERIIAENVC